MDNELSSVADKVYEIGIKYPHSIALKKLERLVESNHAPFTPFLVTGYMAFARANLAEFSDDEKVRLDRLVTEGERRTKKTETEESPSVMFARGLARLFRVVSDQANGRSVPLEALTSAAEDGRTLIETASVSEPDNDVFELAHAIALRFFSAKGKRERKQEGIAQLQRLSQRKGRTGVTSKFMLIDHAMRRRDYDLVLAISDELKKALPNAACPPRFSAAAHLALGDTQIAKRELETALKLSPTDPDIKEELAKLEQIPVPSPPPSPPYIANRNRYSMEIHKSHCYWVTQMNDTNKLPCGSLDEVAELIRSAGYNGCRYCLPRYDRDTLTPQQVLTNLEEDLGR